MNERSFYLARGHSPEWVDWWLGLSASWDWQRPLTRKRERELFLVGSKAV